MRRVSESALEFDPSLLARLHAGDITEEAERPVLRALRQCWQTALTPCQKRYLLLYYQQHMTMRAIAEQCGVDITTVSRTLKRARIRLRGILQYYLPSDAPSSAKKE